MTNVKKRFPEEKIIEFLKKGEDNMSGHGVQ
jgi:hypothetical protein